MNPIQIRESIINVLLQQCDALSRDKDALQKQVADLMKEIEALKPTPQPDASKDEPKLQ